MTGLNISHESVWRMVQSAGTWARNRADGLSAAAKAESSAGTYATDILYEEMDGVYLSLQGKDRQENGPSKEMKVSIAYSGVCEDASGRRTLARYLMPGLSRRENSAATRKAFWLISMMWTVSSSVSLTAMAAHGFKRTWYRGTPISWTSSIATRLSVHMSMIGPAKYHFNLAARKKNSRWTGSHRGLH